MSEYKKITQITDADVQKIINNSVMGEANRLVGNASEQKKMFVRPIANTDGSPNVMAYVIRLAVEVAAAMAEGYDVVSALEEAYEAITKTVNQVEANADYAVNQANTAYDNAVAARTIAVEAQNKVEDATSIAEEALLEVRNRVAATNEVKKIYGTDAFGFPMLYDLADLGVGSGGSGSIDPSEFVKKTDYAGLGVPGIVQNSVAGAWYSGIEIGKEGTISLHQPTENDFTSSKFYHGAILGKDLYKWMRIGLTTSDESFTDEEKESARDLISAVGVEDYATSTDAGVLKVNYGNSNAALYRNNQGLLLLGEPTADEIEAQNVVKAISTKHISQATMVALTMPKDSTIWTEDTTDEAGAVVKGTKTKAREILGAVGINDWFDSKKAGLVKGAGTYGARRIAADNPEIAGVPRDIDKYFSLHPSFLMCKGTMDNIQATYVQDGIENHENEFSDSSKAIICGWLGAAQAKEHIVYMQRVSYVHDNDYEWHKVRFAFPSLEDETPDTTWDIAQQLYNAGYDGNKIAKVLYSASNGYTSEELLGVYSHDGSTLTVVTNYGTEFSEMEAYGTVSHIITFM